MTERNKAIPAAYLLLEKSGSILLMLRKGSGYYDGWWSVPAGHVDDGELPKECLVRETKEELGIEIQTKDLKLVHTMYRTKHDETTDRADYFFTTSKWNGEPTIQEPHKCDEIRWFSLHELPEKMMPHVRRAVESAQSKITYSELSLVEIQTNPQAL